MTRQTGMQSLDLGDIYFDACAAYEKVPSQAGLDAWESVLGEYRVPEVKQALAVWRANNGMNECAQRTRGAVMPGAIGTEGSCSSRAARGAAH